MDKSCEEHLVVRHLDPFDVGSCCSLRSLVRANGSFGGTRGWHNVYRVGRKTLGCVGEVRGATYSISVMKCAVCGRFWIREIRYVAGDGVSHPLFGAYWSVFCNNESCAGGSVMYCHRLVIPSGTTPIGTITLKRSEFACHDTER